MTEFLSTEPCHMYQKNTKDIKTKHTSKNERQEYKAYHRTITQWREI